MKSDEVLKLLNICESTLYVHCKRGLIGINKLASGMKDYNEDDVRKVLADREKKIDDYKIVLINPETQNIEKTCNNIDDVVDDLKITKTSMPKCLTHRQDTCFGFILKYKKDATDANIKLYSSKFNDKLAKQRRKIVLIDPKTQAIEKIYNDKNEIIVDLNLNPETALDLLQQCLNHANNTCNGFILKYLEDATEDNIKLYSSKHNFALDGTRRCPRCKSWEDIIIFKSGYCSPCRKEVINEQNSSYNSFFAGMAQHIKISANTRLQRGRIDAGICTIDEQFLKELYELQAGLCYYSGLEMEISPKSNWQASPERLDNTIGYTKENTRLVCLEFNVGHNQWNKSKINSLKILCDEDTNIEELEKKIEDAKKIGTKAKPGFHKGRKIKNNIKYYKCCKCNKFKIIQSLKHNVKNVQIMHALSTVIVLGDF